MIKGLGVDEGDRSSRMDISFWRKGPIRGENKDNRGGGGGERERERERKNG